MTVQAYPLHWPEGWPRAKWRKGAQFGTTSRKHQDDKSWTEKSDLTMQEAMKRLRYELERMGVNVVDDMIVSTNLRLNMSGLPRGDQGEPGDPGVAVYWQKKGGTTRVMAIDAYNRVRDNVAAIAKTLEAMRAIERHGGAQVLERAFAGFAALPPPRSCWDILGVKPDASTGDIHRAFISKAKLAHPDAGGSDAAMSELNQARDQALKAATA
jgi:hypothetical protein